MKEKKKPLTAAQIALMEPTPFKPATAKMRNKKGMIILNPASGKPLQERNKREWSFEGVHQVYFDDGTVEERPGRYVNKMERQ